MTMVRSVNAGALRGLAFDIRDLILIRVWAELNDWQIFVQLDHGLPDEEYEEVVRLQTKSRSPLCVILWRDAEAVFIQPLIGRRRRYETVSAALESLLGPGRGASRPVRVPTARRQRAVQD
ncbi:MAG: hypothetical protein AB7F35_22450 [Acetobacteraceae bacterium]